VVSAENALAGDPDWWSGRDAPNHELELYLDRASAAAGETVGVQASSDAPHRANWKLYRFGWYVGAGARWIADGGPVDVTPQPGCPPSADTALVQCRWSATFQLTLPQAAVSGLFAVKLTRDDGFIAFAPLVVHDGRGADLLFQASIDTWQAYNGWGGESLYEDTSGRMRYQEAEQVSFDRPYAEHHGLGLLAANDEPLARFLERNGYDVTYTTNGRVSAGGAAELARGRVFISSGHDEYWTGEERDALESARDAGTPLLFFGANAGYWKIRFEPSTRPDDPRVITCYKGSSRDDPVRGPGITGVFRAPPLSRPENALVGGMYDGWTTLAHPWVVFDASAWLFEGTGLRAGDVVSTLVGYEFDRSFSNGASPAGLRVLARSPVVHAEARPSVQETVAYRAGSGALVFDAGTIEWTSALNGGTRGDARVERMTANVLHEALGLPVPAALVSPAPPESPPALGPFADSVATVVTGLAAPTAVAVLRDGALAVAEAGLQRIVRVGRGGDVTVLAGSGEPQASLADGVPGAMAQLAVPAALLALADGTLLYADAAQHVVRRIADDAQHTVTTLADRLGQRGFADGPGRQALFSAPSGLAVDPVTGNVLVADSANHRVRTIDAQGGVTTLVGSSAGQNDGPAARARLHTPTALATAPDGRVFVVASGGYRVKVIQPDSARTVATLAGASEGFTDGRAADARLAPQAGAVFSNGEVIFSDPGSLRVRALVPGATPIQVAVHSVAGSGQSGSADGPGASASFTLPLGLAVGPDGTIYVADAGSGTVRALHRQSP